MKRRDFVRALAAAAVIPAGLHARGQAAPHGHHGHQHGAHQQGALCETLYASPRDAMQSPRETLAFLPAMYTGTGIDKPDYLAVVDVDPQSATYSRVVARLEMPHTGDELHHFGWNACSSCHGEAGKSRRYLVLPGLTSGRIHIVDVQDPRQPRLHKVIEGDEIARRVNLSTPHTVHCLADGKIMISMLGDAQGNAPGGFLLLNEQFDILGRWEKSNAGMQFNYDFWYQPRHNMMVSSQWAAPRTVRPGFKLDDVQAGKYGQALHFWDWQKRELLQTVDLGPEGLIPLEVRWHHNPDSTHGFVGAALSSSIWHCYRADGRWQAEKVVQADPVEIEGWPFPVPGLTTDLVLSLDDRWLYLSNWLHGDLRQYDVSDPSRPKLTGQVWLGGLQDKGPQVRGKPLTGGPQMLQLSLDGRRLYVTNSLFSSWDNQFYPEIARQGSHMLQLDCDTEQGGLTLNDKFFVDFGREPNGPSRAHEIRFPGGDCTSDIWI
ncbi:MAG: selenium-binding family protein [Pirellulaceae bacterium]|nr:selenium-binding family protein [Pirellulaceae bacterium]